VVPRDFQAVSVRRAERAEALAARYEPARAALVFFAGVARLQARVAAMLEPEAPYGAVLRARPWLVEFVQRAGPPPLRQAARSLGEAALRQAIDGYLAGGSSVEPLSFFARVLLQAWAATAQLPGRASGPEGRCPRCAHPPQAGCLRPAGEGEALWLVCSLCLSEWEFSRGVCPACGLTDPQRIAYFSASLYGHVQTQACEGCRRYFHSVRAASDPQAIADVDEIAALPLDVWMREQGFVKIQPNLIGM
jgi:formate dehydrogenase maturation protein FdhE